MDINELESVSVPAMGREDKYAKSSFYFRMIIAVCSVLTFLVILVAVLVLVPRAVTLMDTAQRTLDNLETVSEELKALELAEAVKNIEDNTATAMQDVSNAMQALDELDVDTLNQSVQDLSESVEEFRKLFK
ncbi:MAG: hypothetical protein K5871_08100 [Lachnospiraceae bacterium]|nr:hypothetical protein [Lachnospiraceae bacterium]